MKITEITLESRKIINRLQNLYMSYSLDFLTYDELMNFILGISDITDPDIIRERDIIKVKLYNEVIALLRK